MEGAAVKRPLRRTAAALAGAALALCAGAGAAAAPAQVEELAPNDPASCPYTGGDPERLAAAGFVALGGFEFGPADTAAVDRLLGFVDIRWVATEHFELGFGLGPYAIKAEERDKVRAELEELAQVWPEVKPKTRTLDPWLRAYLHARRLERVWDRFLEIAQVEESAFPDGSSPWRLGTPYMGEGPYLGQRGKYEVLVLPSEAASVLYLRTNYGLTTAFSQRWNIIDRDTLQLVTHTGHGDLRVDAALHGHVAFNVAINLLDGYRHYSYETPVWLREGLAHFVEREINPRFNTFDRAEGSGGLQTTKWKWEPEVKQLVRSGEAARVAQLVAKQSYADLAFDDHLACWSMTDYMIRAHPAGYAALTRALHGRKQVDGLPDGSKLDDAHREAFEAAFGGGYRDFDAAWAAWVLENYEGS